MTRSGFRPFVVQRLPHPEFEADEAAYHQMEEHFLPLSLTRDPGEDWLAALLRRANPEGCGVEAEELYNEALDSGMDPEDAAFSVAFNLQLLTIEDQ